MLAACRVPSGLLPVLGSCTHLEVLLLSVCLTVSWMGGHRYGGARCRIRRAGLGPQCTSKASAYDVWERCRSGFDQPLTSPNQTELGSIGACGCLETPRGNVSLGPVRRPTIIRASLDRLVAGLDLCWRLVAHLLAAKRRQVEVVVAGVARIPCGTACGRECAEVY